MNCANSHLLSTYDDFNVESTAEAAAQAALQVIAVSKTFNDTYKSSVGDMLKAAIQSVLTTLLQKKLAALEQRVAELEKRPPPPAQRVTTDWASLVNSKSAEQVKQRHQLINCIAQDSRDRTIREHNVIIAGLKSATENIDELTTAKDFLNAIGFESSKVHKVRRFRPGKSTPDAPGLLQVQFKNASDATAALRAGSRHKLAAYTGVYIREDRTPAQQSEFNDLNDQKKKQNDALEANNLLDQPFRYIIHRITSSVRCIHVQNSATQRKCVFTSPTAAQLGISATANEQKQH
jgi:hypothetical protein